MTFLNIDLSASARRIQPLVEPAVGEQWGLSLLHIYPEDVGLSALLTAPVHRFITSNTLANPTEIQVATAHGFTGTVEVLIRDSNSTPNIEGFRTATITGPNTFTVPVNVTVPGTSGEVLFDYRSRTGWFDPERDNKDAVKMGDGSSLIYLAEPDHGIFLDVSPGFLGSLLAKLNKVRSSPYATARFGS